MAVTAADIKTRLPEFCDVDQKIIDVALLSAEDCINRPQWGEKRADLAVVYLAGHLLKFTIEGSELDAGPLTSEREGAVAVSYAVGDAFKDSAYGSTVYGRHYLQLLNGAFPERFEC